MSRKKPLDKTEARERRNRMLDAAAAGELSLTDGVREMRAIAGMTQEEFALHRSVSARVIKALELNKGNPTVATLNRIGHFFGLEVAFVPVKKRMPATLEQHQAGKSNVELADPTSVLDTTPEHYNRTIAKFQELQEKMLSDVQAIMKKYEHVQLLPPRSEVEPGTPIKKAGRLSGKQKSEEHIHVGKQKKTRST